MFEPLSCPSCGNPLVVESASGVCPACAPPREPDTVSLPGGAAPDQTPNRAADRTPPEPERGAPEPELGWPLAPAGYVLVRPIGRGGMGDVYVAHDTLANQFVALKFLRDPGDPGLLARFVLEFRTLRAIDHPNAVRVLGHDFHRAAPYLVLELMDGGSLADKLKCGPFEPPVAIKLIRQVAAAVRALHEYRGPECPRSGILHRDIKPGNVLLTREGEPKLADFGLAKFLDAKTVHTLNGMVGTLRYMPPEQINGENGRLGYATDVYGLGATLYQLLTGRAPFAQEEFGPLLLAVLNDPPDAPHAVRPELTRGLSAVILKCLEKDPRDRYQTVTEFLAALDRWAESPVPPPVSRRARAGKWFRRNRAALAAVALLAVGGALGAARPTPAPADRPPAPSAEELAAGRLDALRAEFAEKRRVALVPARGNPSWHRWLVGPTVLGESPLRDGACFFQAAGGPSMLELYHPTTEAYRFRAEVQLVSGELGDPRAAPPEVGVFLGHALYARAAGPPSAGFLLFNFSDYDRELAAGRAPKAQHVRFGWRCTVGGAGQAPGAHTVPFKVGTFWATDRFPAPWWTITLDVSPDLLVARWARDGGAETELVRLTRADRLRAFAAYKVQSEIVAKRAPRGFDPGPQPDDWTPTGGLGIWGHRARVALRNVTVSQLQQ